ncbi:MAG TPA: ABC transporter substrate-binding protein [Candidatus Sulfotelmatobacter sp.]|nr:ABC transporter substrate-binding protein [Candidatus Sulfotelmatobacter sp.]
MSRIRRSLAALALGLSLSGASPARSRAATAPPALDAHAADSLSTRRPAGATRKSLERWAQSASLSDLMWILRRDPAELGEVGPMLAAAAYRHVPADRAALRQRLWVRLDEASRKSIGHRSGGGPPASEASATLARPLASVFRVAAILPDSGDYADFARELRIGLDAGLASIPAPGGHTPELELWSTGNDHPARCAAALDQASRHCGVLVGELLSVNTIALATGARLLDLPLISPTATDEAIGTVGPGVFQIGPSGWSRGAALARSLVDKPGLRVGALISGGLERNAFALGFGAEAESLGGAQVWMQGYPPGTTFRDEVRAMGMQRLDALLWDGESREAETLLRELARQKVSVRLCGGEELSPERMHAESRLLLDGVRIVADEWRLPSDQQAALDSIVAARGESRSTGIHVRGWLAGRAIAEALASGALCPEEVAAALAARCGAGPWLASHRFLDVFREGATLPLVEVSHGKTSPVVP